VLAAARGVDQQDARGRRRVRLAALGVLDPVAGGEPVERELIIGIGEAVAGAARMRRLARIRISLPGGVENALDLVV
jgi:hypothetical protein